MSSTNRKFVVAYVVLVGIPLLGLIGVLKAGKHLSAPHAVDGSWKFEVPQPLSSVCSTYLSSVSSTPVSVSQSGRELVVNLNGRVTTGTLDGTLLRAEFSGTSIPAECADRPMALVATVDPGVEPRTLAGSLTVRDCAMCSVNFRAVRQPRAPSGGSH